MPEEPAPAPKKLGLKQAEFIAVNAPVAPGSSSGNEPLELLRVNRQHEIAHGTAPEPALTPEQKSRRWRDYLLLLAAVDGPLGVLLYLSGDPASHVFALAGMGLYTGALTWVMFVVMSDHVDRD